MFIPFTNFTPSTIPGIAHISPPSSIQQSTRSRSSNPFSNPSPNSPPSSSPHGSSGPRTPSTLSFSVPPHGSNRSSRPRTPSWSYSVPHPSEAAPQIPQPPLDFAQVVDQLGRTMANSVADAIMHSQNQRVRVEENGSEAKGNPPTEFDGSARKKLDVFLAECEIMFATAPRKYRTDASRVLCAGSYLKGNPKKWFTNFFQLPPEQQPAWLRSWIDFKDLLRRQWGLEDPEGAAEAELQKLSMADKDHVVYFTAIFRTIQYRLPSWSDRNLRNAYYSALAPRIRNQFVSAGRIPPTNLDSLIQVAEDLDRAYWTNYELNKSSHSEEKKSGASSENKSGSDSPPKKKKKTSKSNSTPTPAASDSTPSSTPATSGTNKKKDPAYKKLLGPDGKLLPQERERRIANGLCLLCGQKGHMAEECPKRTKQPSSTPTLARATITVSPPAPTTASITEVP
jgi:hypothetical protein